MRILFLSLWYPFPPDNGSRLRIFNLIRQLSRRHEVHLVAFSPEAVSPERRQTMAAYCASIDVVTHRPFEPRRLRALAGFLSRWPRSAFDTYSPDMQRRLEQTARRHAVELVIASQIDMALYPLRLAKLPRLLEELELTRVHDEFARQRHVLRKLRHGLTWWKLSRYLVDLLPAYAACTVASDIEREKVLSILPSHPSVVTVPNGIDPADYSASYGPPEADTLVYVGALTYPPNLDAMQFFVREILPRIRAQRPKARLMITGKLDGVPRDCLPHGEGVVLTGYLPDARPAVARGWLSIAPLQAGGGTRVKILESLALGTPMVATSKGAEGLDLAPGHDLLIADDPAEFAAAAVRVLDDERLRACLARNGRQAVAEKYDWRIIGRAYCDLLDSVVVRAKEFA